VTITVAERPPAPPEERLWRRYSPRGELPLSASGSLFVHVLAGGIMLLVGIYLASYLYKPDHPLPVEPVRLALDGKGAKPGTPGGREGAAPGQPGDEDVGPEPGDEGPGPRPPALTPVERKRVEQQYDDASQRFLADIDTDSSKRWARLPDELRQGLARGLARTGPPPRPGKKGDGGKGDGKGGKLELTQREKRMLRWHMVFTANSGKQYLAQLKGLGAILALPVKEGKGADPEYKVVRDLKPGGKLLAEDVTKIQRIYWIDDKPQSVKDVVAALGLKLAQRPSRFVAFMPEALENELFRMEKGYVEKELKQKFDEARIEETRFRVVLKKGKYQPEIVTVVLKK
jgi:hypothetical protein